MRKLACLLVSMVALFLAPHGLYAQTTMVLPRFIFGVMGGYNLVAYNTNEFPILISDPHHFIVQNGRDYGSFFGAIGEFPFTSDMRNFVIIEASYDSKPSRFTNITGDVGLIGRGYDTEYSIAADLSYYLLNVGYRFNFWGRLVPSGLGIQVCASFGLISHRNFNRTLSIDSAYGRNAGTNETTFPISSAEGFRFAIRSEVTYDIPLFSSLLVTPSAGFDAPISKVDPSLNWRASSLYFGIAVQYMLR